MTSCLHLRDRLPRVVRQCRPPSQHLADWCVSWNACRGRCGCVLRRTRLSTVHLRRPHHRRRVGHRQSVPGHTRPRIDAFSLCVHLSRCPLLMCCVSVAVLAKIASGAVGLETAAPASCPLASSSSSTSSGTSSECAGGTPDCRLMHGFLVCASREMSLVDAVRLCDFVMASKLFGSADRPVSI